MRFRIGLYGATMNLLFVTVGVFSGTIDRSAFTSGALAGIAFLMALSGFVVYFFVVARYVEKREGLRNPIVFDSLVGMLSEFIVATLTAVLAGTAAAVQELLTAGEAAFLPNLGHMLLLSLLWTYATFMLSILIAGNVAGAVGWFLLKTYRPAGR